MAQIIFNVPDADLPRVVNATVALCNYAARQLPGETQAQFTKRMGIQYYKSLVAQFEGDASANTARQTAVTSAENIQIT